MVWGTCEEEQPSGKPGGGDAGDRDRGLSLKHHVPALASLVADGPPWYLRCL